MSSIPVYQTKQSFSKGYLINNYVSNATSFLKKTNLIFELFDFLALMRRMFGQQKLIFSSFSGKQFLLTPVCTLLYNKYKCW